MAKNNLCNHIFLIFILITRNADAKQDAELMELQLKRLVTAFKLFINNTSFGFGMKKGVGSDQCPSVRKNPRTVNTCHTSTTGPWQ